MKSLQRFSGALSLALLLGLVVTSAPAVAQTLTALNLERTVALNNILTTITPNVPASALAALAGGALELREQVNFNPQQNSLTQTYFVVPSGSPASTNLSQLPASSLIAITALNISRIDITSNPTPAVNIVGAISQSTNTPYGNYLGGTGTFSFGYTTDNPPKINNVIETVAGSVVVYSAASNGTFTIVTPSTGGGGTTTGVSIVVNGSTSATPSFQTTTNQIILDASKSTSTNAGALTFTWTVTQGSASISFPNGNQSIANVQLGSGKITYVITLKVTDSTGASTTIPISVQLI